MRCKCSVAVVVDVDVDRAFDSDVILSELEGSLFSLTTRNQ